MNIVAFSSGSLVSIFPIETFTPLNGLNGRQIIDAISRRYNFSNSPSVSFSPAELAQNGIVFELGFFETGIGEITINRLSIHNDGVVVRANKTEHADAFFDDMTCWLIEEYGCRNVSNKMLYLSEVIVEFEIPLANALNNYEKIKNLILANVNEYMETTAAEFNAFSVELFANSNTLPKFIVERRLGTSVKDQRYFCSAPLTTERHIQVLAEIEHLLS